MVSLLFSQTLSLSYVLSLFTPYHRVDRDNVRVVNTPYGDSHFLSRYPSPNHLLPSPIFHSIILSHPHRPHSYFKQLSWKSDVRSLV